MDKPKLTVSKAINKFLISWNIKLNEDTPVYYAWSNKRVPEWKDNMYPKDSYLSVDFDGNKREWYVGYIVSLNNRKFCTIDDITGACSIYQP